MSQPSRSFRFCALGCASVLLAWWCFFAFHFSWRAISKLDVWMLDVGQGESILLREPGGKKLLFDGGPSDIILAELGRILPAWDRTLDLMVLSHNHSDHVRGLISVLDRYQVKEVWLSGAQYNNDDYRVFRERLNEYHLVPKIAFFDQTKCQRTPPCPPTQQFGALALQVFHPLENALGDQPRNQHDDTVVVKATYKQQSILLTGDLDENHEQQILETCPQLICSVKSTILQVPHHGSATGLSLEFLAAVEPKVALIPVGIGNTFHHPSPLTLQKLATAHISTYRTDTEGRIHLSVYPDHFIVGQARASPALSLGSAEGNS